MMANKAPVPAEVIKKIQDKTKQKKEPWEVLVDVYLKPPKFTLETCLETDPTGRIMFHNRRRPGFIIRFRLHDEQHSGYRFPAVPADAVWSQKGSTCPNTVGVWEVLEPFAVENGGLDLLVYNENGSPPVDDFQYNLRVFDAAGHYLPIDPGGGDKNGADS